MKLNFLVLFGWELVTKVCVKRLMKISLIIVILETQLIVDSVYQMNNEHETFELMNEWYLKPWIL